MTSEKINLNISDLQPLLQDIRVSPSHSSALDGYDIKKFFPTADHGSVLLTSRLQGLTELGGSFPVQ